MKPERDRDFETNYSQLLADFKWKEQAERVRRREKLARYFNAVFWVTLVVMLAYIGLRIGYLAGLWRPW